MWVPNPENGDELYNATPNRNPGFGVFRPNKRLRSASQSSPYERPILMDFSPTERSTIPDASSRYSHQQPSMPLCLPASDVSQTVGPNYPSQTRLLATSHGGEYSDTRIPWSLPPDRPPETWRPTPSHTVDINANSRSMPPIAATTSIIDQLLQYRVQGGETTSFCKIAIGSLMKKLQDHEDKRNSLIAAITTRGFQSRDCVPIQKTLDGRLQIDGKKVFPHVIYARIWRWPNVKLNNLRHLPHCQYGFHMQLNLVCINPYHYQIISSNSDQDNRIPSVISTNTLDNPADGKSPEAPSTWTSTARETLPQSFIAHPGVHSSLNVSDPASAEHSRTLDSGPQHDQMAPSRVVSMQSFLPYAARSGYRSWDTSLTLPQVSQNGYPINVSVIPEQSTHTIGEPYVEEHYANPMDFSSFQTFTSQQQPKYWCSITYFEFDIKVGQTFKANSATSNVTVDGYADISSESRFCLGALTNVRRGEESKTARGQIGKGVELEHRANGDIWLRCLSYQSVFVESHYLDKEVNNTLGFSAHEIYPAVYLKIFDLNDFYNGIMQKSSQIIAAAETDNGATCTSGIPLDLIFENGISADDNRRFCTLRVSFIKGWGSDLMRKSIQETPCWIEVHLYRPLQLLDQVLRTMSSQVSVRSRLSRMNPQTSFDIVDTDSD